MQHLPGDAHPFERLVRLLARGDYCAAAIDAPFAIPDRHLPVGGWPTLLRDVEGLPTGSGSVPPSGGTLPNLVPIPGPRMERETPGQRPRPNFGHPQGARNRVVGGQAAHSLRVLWIQAHIAWSAHTTKYWAPTGRGHGDHPHESGETQPPPVDHHPQMLAVDTKISCDSVEPTVYLHESRQQFAVCRVELRGLLSPPFRHLDLQ